MKTCRAIVAIVAAIVFVAAAVVAVIVFWEQIRYFFEDTKEKIGCCHKKFQNDEYVDFADV